jgi:rod shape determining protein RodA
MWFSFKTYLKNFDWLMLSSVILLSAFGLLQLYSIALGQDNVNFSNFNKQLIFLLIAIICLFIFTFIDWKLIKSLNIYLYLLAIILLIAVLFFGQDIRGATSWFSIFGLGIQPAEIVKVILIIYLSAFFTNLATKVKTVRHLIFSALSTLLLVILVMMQPDFGTAMMLLSIWFIVVLVSGFQRRYFVIMGILIVIFSVLTWNILFQDYQKDRILTFINPSRDLQKTSYNVNQAIIAFGSGGLMGQGLGFGSQTQLKFLPEAHTDFIISVIAEELGFLGIILILSFFAIFFARCLKSLKIVKHDFGTYFIVSSMGLIFIQMFITIGMNIGIIPVVGLSLPFVSYGGSSLISLFILLGIMQNIIIKSKINY